MKLKCIIIDDDQFAIDTLTAYVEKIPELNVHATYTNAIQALTTIRSEDAIDFVFLDIEMPELSGLTLAKSIRDKTKFLIFTTGHTAHALNAFNLNATQYLLKPITFEKFATVISYIMGNLLASEKIAQAPTKLQFIKADNKNAFHYIDATEIIYIEAAKNYVVIHTIREKFITHMGLNHVEAAVSVDMFIRINKSNIIAKNAIKKVDGHSLILKNGAQLQIGTVYKANFLAFLNSNLLRA